MKKFFSMLFVAGLLLAWVIGCGEKPLPPPPPGQPREGKPPEGQPRMLPKDKPGRGP